MGKLDSNKLTYLNQIALESVNKKDRFDIIKDFTEAALKILAADFGFAWWKSDEGTKYQLAYKSLNTPYNPPIPRKKGGNFTAQKSRVPYFVSSVNKQFYEKQHDVTPYMKSYAIIPVFYKNNIYGNLVICFKKTRYFSDDEKSLCQALGNLTAQAITIHRLYNDLKKFNTRLEKLVRERTQQLIQDNAKDDAILSSLGEGIVATDTEGKIILINPQAEEILGLKAEEVMGKQIYATQPLYEENGNEVKLKSRPAWQAMIKRRKIKANNYYVHRKDGSVIPVSITVTPIMLKDQLMGAIEVIHDIIREKEIDKAKSELISLASHQLRTPLSAINWYTEALIKNELGKVNPKQRKYLQEIANANWKMIELVYDFLNVSRIELGTFVIQFSTFSVTEVASGVIKELRPLIAKKKIKITECYSKGLEQIQADKKIVRLILQNLISNSVKYTPPKGQINVDIGLAKQPRPKMIIHITDNGYGIPKHQQTRIFTKLFRADNVTQLATEGTGLGLYIVKSFVDLCKGKIWFRSSLNKGTEFHIELPLNGKRK